MPLVTTASIVDSARRDGHGVAAFNVITLEHAEAIAAGAERAGQPGRSCRSARTRCQYPPPPAGPLAAAVVAVANVPLSSLAVHLDHVEERTCWTRQPTTASARRCSTPRTSTTRRTLPRPAHAARMGSCARNLARSRTRRGGRQGRGTRAGSADQPQRGGRVRCGHQRRRPRSRRGKLARHGRPHCRP